MKTKLTLALIALALLCVAAISQSKPQQWEYKFQYQCDEKKANSLAVDGWELVNMTASGSGTSTAVNCAFKRPKS